MSRIMAIDYGEKRTGIAVTDPFQIIASSLQTLATQDVFPFLKDYFSKQEVELVLIGEPKQMNGEPSESSEIIEKFVGEFKREFPNVEVKRVDERFTSKIAYKTLITSRLNKKKRQDKSIIDRISATIMLQDYLWQNAQK